MLQNGSKGADVKAVQAKLVSLGFKIDVDGDYGDQTTAAVRKFQSASKLAADGIVGDATAAKLGVKLTAPAPVEAPAPKGGPTAGKFVDGWYEGARRVPAHAGRVGGAITPRGVVAHTTDCPPGTMPTIVRSWAMQDGNGACAHFCIGRTETGDDVKGYPNAGIVQMVPIGLNGNHAGGARLVGGVWQQWHGNYKMPDGSTLHPNLCTVGIEIDCAGRLFYSHGVAMHADSGQCFTGDDVFVDDRGKPWHKVTDYQLQALGDLIEALDDVLPEFPDGVKVLSNGNYEGNGVAWAEVKGVRLVGHATLDPNNKTDPGPQVIEYLRSRFEI